MQDEILARLKSKHPATAHDADFEDLGPKEEIWAELRQLKKLGLITYDSIKGTDFYNNGLDIDMTNIRLR